MSVVKTASISAMIFGFATSAMTNYFAYLGDVLDAEEHRYALEVCAESYSYRREAEEYSGGYSSGSLAGLYNMEAMSDAETGPPGDSGSEGGPSFGNFIVRSWENGLGEIFNAF